MRRYFTFLVLVFSLIVSSAFAAEITFWGEGKIGDARSVAIGAGGEVWVGSSGRIVVFDRNGKFARYDTRVSAQTNGVAFDKSGNLVIAANDGFLAWVIKGKDGKDKVLQATGFGQYSPWDVAVDDQGFAWATDGGNARIKKFRREGELLLLEQTITPPENAPMERPFSLAFDGNNRLIVSDERKPGLWVFERDGTFVQKLFETEKFWRIRKKGDELFAVTEHDTVVLDAKTYAVKRRIQTPGGFYAAMGFAVDDAGNLYFGNLGDERVRKFSPDGKLLGVLGPAYKATVKIPETIGSGQTLALDLKLETIASGDGIEAPKFSLALQPATLPGEPDANWFNAESGKADSGWEERRRAQFQAQERVLTTTQNATTISAPIPAGVPSSLYQLIIRDGGKTAPQAQPIAVLSPSASGNLSLYIPRNRSVFSNEEPIEIAAILRARENLTSGKIKFSLAKRTENSAWQNGATPCGEYSVAGGKPSQTVSFLCNEGALYPGRYVLQAEFISAPLRGDSSNNQTWRDVWPLEIVSEIQATRFKILFPEWSAGYTHIWGPFTGKGMIADAKNLADSGVNFYDATTLHRGAGLPLSPVGEEAARVPELMKIAQSNAALPAPEKFEASSPLEIELQEALRNNMKMQRDIWGSHDLPDWGYADELSTPADNRRARIWTQWQREWPSWAGHRYLTLSLTDENQAEPKALRAKLGVEMPSREELDWARNGALWTTQRGFISDSIIPPGQRQMSAGTDGAGNIYIAAEGGAILKFDKSGKLLQNWKLPAGEMIDMAVAKNGTLYIASSSGGNVLTVAPDGTFKTWPVVNMGAYSPRGIWLDNDGTLLVTDMTKGRIHRYTTEGKLLGDYGAPEILQQPGGVATLKDGTIYAADLARGGLSVFKSDGTPLRFLQGIGSNSPGGKMDVFAAPDDTLWVTGWGAVLHVDRDGKRIGQAGHNTFAPGGFSLPMSVALTPAGNLLVCDVATPYVQEVKTSGEPVRILGGGSLFADVRLDRVRYTWSDSIIASVWRPLQQLGGADGSTLTAYARQGEGAWQKLNVEFLSGRDYRITPPKLEGKSTLRLVWGAADANKETAPRADFSIELSKTISASDAQKMRDVVARQLKWKDAWAKERMGALVRWTKESDEIAASQNRALTQNLAPTNYGTPDNMAMGVWTPLRREGVVAEANNEGHDHGSFPLHGAWYVARTLDGPKAKPIWASLLQWYWFGQENARGEKEYHLARPLRDVNVLLGTGVSGIGPGMLPSTMDGKQRALHQKINGRLERLGEATMNLKMAGAGGVGVLYSYTQESLDPDNNEHFWTAHAAWYDLLRAHVPTAVVTEESVAEGALQGRFKAVFLPGIQYPLPEKTLAALQKFQESGGQVWLDAGTRISVPNAKILKARYRPFWIQDAYYWVNSGYGIGGYDGNSEYAIMKEGSNARLAAIKEAFGAFAIQDATCDDADVFVQERRGGGSTYVFASNDHYPDLPLYKTHLAFQTPAPASVNFTLKGGAIYDALAMKKIPAGAQKIDFTDDEPARLWAVLPRAIEGLSTRASYLENAFFATISILDAQKQNIPAVVPLEITITDAAKKISKLWRATDEKGICRVKIPAGALAPSGAWQISVKELLSGKNASAATQVSTPPAPKLQQLDDKVLMFDGGAITKWLAAMKTQEVWIALDKEQSPLAAQADKIAATFKARGINARIINISDLPEIPLVSEYTLTDEQRAAWQKVRSGGAVGLRQNGQVFREVGPMRAIFKPLVLIGNPAQNLWLQELESTRILRRNLSQNYPGANRALLQFAWSPFYDGFDALCISATDEAGLQAGISALAKLK